MQNEVVLEARNLVKRYGGILALDDMHIEVEQGSIHAVVGENGAGKSTLMKILAGSVRADQGAIRIFGTPVSITSPNDAKKLGISIFYQELSVFPHRSVLANLFPNREPTRFGVVSTKTMRERSREVLEHIGLDVDLDQAVGALSLAERQLVELCRVLLQSPKLLILDEPNSALNEAETRRLFQNLVLLRDQGVSLLYVSHRLREVFEIADVITVCRNGQHVMTKQTAETSTSEVVEAMIGGKQEEMFPPFLPVQGLGKKPTLRIHNLSFRGGQHISFEGYPGEIIGLAGLEGSGAKELLYTLFGVKHAECQSAVLPDGGAISSSPTEAARRGICLIPSDRKRCGLMMEKTLVDNLSHVKIGALKTHALVLNRAKMENSARRQIEHVRIKTESMYARANQLSGGNQQKVVVGKWLEVDPALVLLDDPTRGVDVGAKREIYELIQDLARQGRTVLFFSTELFELVGLCHRVLCFFEGQIIADLDREHTSEPEILHLINTGRMIRA
jgi:ABC-type sugar transport system ATPase subunit